MPFRPFHTWSLFLLLQSAAFAEVPSELIDQTPHDTATPLRNIQRYTPPRKIPDLKDIFKNIHGSYSVSYMGPRFDGASNETYNIYLPDVSSVQLYHTAQIGYQINADLQIGVNEAIVQNLADDIHGLNGNTYNRSFEWYDPNIFFNLPRLVQIPGWFVFTSASFSLPFTTASQDQKKITEFIIQQSWSVKTYPSAWGYGFHLYFNPQFYADPKPDGFNDRQTLSFSFGHNLTYRVSPNFSLATSTNFYVEHRSPDSKGFLHLGEGLPDYFQFSATVSPNVFPLFLSVGGYIQSLFFAPSWSTTIIGGSFRIGF